MSIHTMRNLLGRFNRKPSILIAIFDKSNLKNILDQLDTEEFDIRIVVQEYDVTLCPINVIVTDKPNDTIMGMSYKLHCPVIMVTEKGFTSNNDNLYISQLNNIKNVVSSLILYKRFVLK